MKDLVNDLARGQLKLVVSMTERAATKYGFPSEAKPFQKFQDVNGDFWEFGLDSWWRKLSGDRGGSVSVLDEAATIIQGARNTDYGPPERNLTRIANLWTDYLETEITARQVAMMMILLKVSRDVTSPKRDNVVDIAGYAALADEVTQ